MIRPSRAILPWRSPCRLRPLSKDDLGAQGLLATPQQWSRLQAVFPDGVCDYSVPGRGQGPAQTWLSYGDADTPVYGGENLPTRPRASAEGWMSGSFRSQLLQ